jgi:hypothetical protein
LLPFAGPFATDRLQTLDVRERWQLYRPQGSGLRDQGCLRPAWCLRRP